MENKYLVYLMIVVSFSCSSPKKQVTADLMVDLLTVPDETVINNPRPTFSWAIHDERQGAKQTAWQIMVASSLDNIAGDKPDFWDSGKVQSDQSVSIKYAGKVLQPEQGYWWKVRTWDQNGKMGRWSNPQKFNVGSFNAEGLKWPGESRWVHKNGDPGLEYVLENRQALRYQDIAPVSVQKNDSGSYFIAFEKAAFATLKLTLNTPVKADTIIVHLGEKSTPDYQVDRQPGGSISYQKAIIVLKPGLKEYLLELPRHISDYPNSQILAEHMPEVTAFRYVEIEDWKGPLEPENIRQHALLYRFDDHASYFQSSDKNLNQIWDLCKHTLKVTPFLGLYIDGTRERMPYEADAYIQQISHYCVDREFAIERYTNTFLIYNPSWPTEWQLHIVLMAWADYMATGNEAALEKYYAELKKKTLLSLAREDGLISTCTGLVTEDFLKSIHYTRPASTFQDIVDWPQGTPADTDIPRDPYFSNERIEGETDRYVFADINSVVNAFHYRNLVLMAEISGLLGKKEDESFFRARAELVKASFNEKLLDINTGLYVDGEGVSHSSLHANMFPVAFGLAPEANYPKIREFIVSKGMACGPYGAVYLFDALYKLGAFDYAFELLTSEDERSWMNMIRFGTTITSEAWDIRFKNNMTWNHAWGASPVYTITRKIFGIEPLEPAFKKVLIHPRPGKLHHAEIKSPTIRGEIYASFINDPVKGFILEFSIPANTTAKIMVQKPVHGEFSLRLNGKKTPFLVEGDCIAIDNLPAGKYILKLIKS